MQSFRWNETATGLWPAGTPFQFLFFFPLDLSTSSSDSIGGKVRICILEKKTAFLSCPACWLRQNGWQHSTAYYFIAKAKDQGQ
jgi:hypothetical protein